LAKFKHPGILNLVEAPIEDTKVMAFVTEPILTNLAALAHLVFYPEGKDKTLLDLIPSEIEVKCMALEFMECINFLHTGAKTMHLNLSPEHIYITKEGKLKLAGFNFI
jgi:SCY1-like protein 2